ncbi:MAG: zinc ABC transporter substrate-binding protein [Treponema sp.]|nr:zinc ABC transporter substrate-binding protein [Treponema sp.]
MKKHIGVVSARLLWFLAAFCAGCGSGSSKAPETARKPVVALSIPPQNYFVSRIAGDLVEILVLAGQGQNPHSYEPSPKQMTELAGARFWVLSGTEFELSLRPKIEALFPGLVIVDGTEGVRFRNLEDHEDDGDDNEEHGGIDRHTWLGREPAKIMARHIRDALCAADEGNAVLYRENCETLITDIDSEFENLRAALEPLRGKRIFVYHPAFGYFLDEFGIIQEAVETGGKEPAPRKLGELIEKARKEKVRVIFVQAQFPAESARTAAAAAGAELVSLDPLAPDWLANIRIIGAALKAAAPGGRE